MTDETTQRLVPVRCFQCGMPINHKQVAFDKMILDGTETVIAFECLNVVRGCCRVVLDRSVNDSRLRRRFTQKNTFTEMYHAPRGERVYTIATDGSTNAYEEVLSMPH